MQNQTGTAILLFSRSADAEARAKSFGGTAADDTRLARQLVGRTERTVARCGLPVFRSDETTQVGPTFGQRLVAAMQDVYDRGFARLIVVGNDCPSLLPSHLRAAARLLDSGKSVLGPDQRGGVWLLGLQRDDFDADRLAGLRWESGELYTDLAAQLPTATNVTQLADLNLTADLRNDWWRLRHVFGELADLITEPPMVAFATGVVLSAVRLARRLGRAPPFVTAG